RWRRGVRCSAARGWLPRRRSRRPATRPRSSHKRPTSSPRHASPGSPWPDPRPDLPIVQERHQSTARRGLMVAANERRMDRRPRRAEPNVLARVAAVHLWSPPVLGDVRPRARSHSFEVVVTLRGVDFGQGLDALHAEERWQVSEPREQTARLDSQRERELAEPLDVHRRLAALGPTDRRMIPYGRARQLDLAAPQLLALGRDPLADV